MTDTVGERVGQIATCQVTGAGCDPSYAWSAPRLAAMLDEVRDAAGLPGDAKHGELVLRIQQLASESLRAGAAPWVWMPGDTVPAGASASDGRFVDRYHEHVTRVPLVEVAVPAFAVWAAAVAAERERRVALSASEASAGVPGQCETVPAVPARQRGAQPDCGASSGDRSGIGTDTTRTAVQDGPGDVGTPPVVRDKGPAVGPRTRR